MSRIGCINAGGPPCAAYPDPQRTGQSHGPHRLALVERAFRGALPVPGHRLAVGKQALVKHARYHTGMELRHDPAADAIYIQLRAVPYAFGHTLDYERRIDYGADQTPMGVELLAVSAGVNLDDLPHKEALRGLLLEHHITVCA